MYLIICGLILFVTYAVYALTYWKRKGVPNDVTSFYSRYSQPFHIADYNGFLKYGKVVGIYEVLKPVLVVADPILARKVMIEQFQCFPNHRFNGDIINSIGSKMLFTLPYESWKRVRAIISPSFSTIKMKALIPSIHAAISTFIKNVEKKVENNETIDVKLYLCSLTLDIISSCSFGVRVQSLCDPNNDVVYNSNKLFSTNISWLSLIAFNCPSLAPIGSLLGISILDFSALKFFRRLILEMIQKRLQTNNTRKDFIQLLMDAEVKEDFSEYSESRRKLTDDEIVDQGIVFMLAGHESTATTLACLVYLLAKHKKCQLKLAQEIDSLTEEETLDFDAIKKLPYLDAIVMETLRIMPPVPRIERRATKDCQLGDISIKKGTLITIPVYTIHHDSDNYENPHQFLPERWLNATEDNLKAFFAFASGPRNCIGERFAHLVLKMCVIHLFRRFEFDVCKQTKEPFDYYTGSLVSSPTEVILKPSLRHENYDEINTRL